MYNYCVYIISITYTTYLYNYIHIYISLYIYNIHICLASGVGAYDPPCGQSIVFGCFPLPPQARRRRVPLPCWRSREPEHHRRWTNWGRFEQMGEFLYISYDGLRVVLFGLRKLIKGTFFWVRLPWNLGHCTYMPYMFESLRHTESQTNGGVKSTQGTVERVPSSA